MPCTYSVNVEVKDHAAALAAAKALGISVRHVTKTNDGASVDLTYADVSEAEFKVAYATAYSEAQAKVNGYYLAGTEETEEYVTLRFNR